MNRPYLMPADFALESELGLKTIKSLKKHYNNYARRKNGIVVVSEVNTKVFPKVLLDVHAKTTEQNYVMEALFDSFIGLMNLTGNSEQAFELLERQAKGELL